LIDLETHEAVFTWMLQRLADAGLVKGKTVGIDATTLEANASLRSIVRRDTGESYQDFLTKLPQASGIETPTRADLARIDRKRKTVQDADDGDTETSRETLIPAAEQIEAVLPEGDGLQEVVGDKGYHSNQSLLDREAVGVRSYLSEPDRGRRTWKKKAEACAAVYRNRRRIRGARGLRLLRLRGERLERPFAHLYETGGMRRVYLRGHTNILKRLLIHTSGFNLGLLMRQLIGFGTPRGLQGRLSALVALLALIGSLTALATRHRRLLRRISPLRRRAIARLGDMHIGVRDMVFTTGC
jgi:transposase